MDEEAASKLAQTFTDYGDDFDGDLADFPEERAVDESITSYDRYKSKYSVTSSIKGVSTWRSDQKKRRYEELGSY